MGGGRCWVGKKGSMDGAEVLEGQLGMFSKKREVFGIRGCDGGTSEGVT